MIRCAECRQELEVCPVCNGLGVSPSTTTSEEQPSRCIRCAGKGHPLCPCTFEARELLKKQKPEPVEKVEKSRYRALAALLDDPVNMACVLREIARRERPMFLPPPVKRQGGGWVIQTLREAMQNLRPGELLKDAEVDAVYEIFSDGESWFISQTDGDLEIGPFPSSAKALTGAADLAEQAGYTLLTQVPWTNKDLTEWPLPRGGR